MFDADELLHLAIHASSIGKHHACIAHLNESLQQQPQNAKAMYLLAVQHAEVGLLDRAIKGMRAALLLDPGLEIARLQLGLLLLDRNRNAEAKEHFCLLGASADHALRACADGMVAFAEGRATLAQEKLALGLSIKSSNSALAELIQRLLEKISSDLARNQQPAAENIDLGAYARTHQ